MCLSTALSRPGYLHPVSSAFSATLLSSAAFKCCKLRQCGFRKTATPHSTQAAFLHWNEWLSMLAPDDPVGRTSAGRRAAIRLLLSLTSPRLGEMVLENDAVCHVRGGSFAVGGWTQRVTCSPWSSEAVPAGRTDLQKHTVHPNSTTSHFPGAMLARFFCQASCHVCLRCPAPMCRERGHVT